MMNLLKEMKEQGDTEESDNKAKEKDEESKPKDAKAEESEKLNPDKEKEEEEKKEGEVAEEPTKPKRPMSLAAVPSFHEQDMARVRMIHGDLLSASILEHARRRLSEVTRDYNNGTYTSKSFSCKRRVALIDFLSLS